MDRIAAFLDMGGRAQFVWPAYILTAIVLVVVLVVSLKALRGNESALGRFEGRRGKRGRKE